MIHELLKRLENSLQITWISGADYHHRFITCFAMCDVYLIEFMDKYYGISE